MHRLPAYASQLPLALPKDIFPDAEIPQLYDRIMTGLHVSQGVIEFLELTVKIAYNQ